MISKPRRFSGEMKAKIALDSLRPLSDPPLKLEFGAYLTFFGLGASKIARIGAASRAGKVRSCVTAQRLR